MTLDLDFSDIRLYAPGSHSGIIVLRPHRPDRQSTLRILASVVDRLGRKEPITGCLWLADESTIRIRTPA